jgi:hypothetical protein
MASRTNQVAISTLEKPFASYQSHIQKKKNLPASFKAIKFKTFKDTKLSTLMFKFAILPFRQF